MTITLSNREKAKLLYPHGMTLKKDGTWFISTTHPAVLALFPTWGKKRIANALRNIPGVIDKQATARIGPDLYYGVLVDPKKFMEGVRELGINPDR